MTKFCVKWQQEDYDGKSVILWESFPTYKAREDFIKLKKESAVFIGKTFDITSTWVQED